MNTTPPANGNLVIDNIIRNDSGVLLIRPEIILCANDIAPFWSAEVAYKYIYIDRGELLHQINIYSSTCFHVVLLDDGFSDNDLRQIPKLLANYSILPFTNDAQKVVAQKALNQACSAIAIAACTATQIAWQLYDARHIQRDYLLSLYEHLQELIGPDNENLHSLSKGLIQNEQTPSANIELVLFNKLIVSSAKTRAAEVSTADGHSLTLRYRKQGEFQWDKTSVPISELFSDLSTALKETQTLAVSREKFQSVNYCIELLSKTLNRNNHPQMQKAALLLLGVYLVKQNLRIIASLEYWSKAYQLNQKGIVFASDEALALLNNEYTREALFYFHVYSAKTRLHKDVLSNNISYPYHYLQHINHAKTYNQQSQCVVLKERAFLLSQTGFNYLAKYPIAQLKNILQTDGQDSLSWQVFCEVANIALTTQSKDDYYDELCHIDSIGIKNDSDYVDFLYAYLGPASFDFFDQKASAIMALMPPPVAERETIQWQGGMAASSASQEYKSFPHQRFAATFTYEGGSTAVKEITLRFIPFKDSYTYATVSFSDRSTNATLPFSGKFDATQVTQIKEVLMQNNNIRRYVLAASIDRAKLSIDIEINKD